jgi:histone H3/H4
MLVQDRARAVSVVGKHFGARFRDGRFSSDFAEALVDALEELGVVTYQDAAPAAPAKSPTEIQAELAALKEAEAKLEASLGGAQG